MSKPISLFSGYSQDENRVTNYCLLILKLLYEENPKYLGEALTTVCGEQIAGRVGVSFQQQERRKASVPDGLITQPAFAIYIEAKRYDWFYDAQLERHLSALNDEMAGLKVLLAIANFQAMELTRFSNIRSICEAEYRNNIIFRSISFEDFLAAVEIAGLPKNLLDSIAEFRNFLSEQDLLPSWREWLDVVNCAGMPEDVLNGGVYMCPAAPGAYTHGRCQYFGMYCSKRVERVAEIEAVVDVDEQNDTAAVKWANVDLPGADLLQRARERVRELRPAEGPTRVFLLGQLHETDFRKDSFGGMQSSKRYFNVAPLGASDAADLAQKLIGRRWSEFA